MFGLKREINLIRHKVWENGEQIRKLAIQINNMKPQEEIPFRAGDVVRLKSGGPKMTVGTSDWADDEYIRLVWFDGERYDTHVISIHSLAMFELVEENDGGDST